MPPLFQPCADGADVIVLEFRPAMLLTVMRGLVGGGLTPLPPHVVYVVLLGTSEQVGRVAAGAVIPAWTVVAGHFVERKGAAKVEFKGNAMSRCLPSRGTDTEYTVPATGPASGPQPTGIRSGAAINVAPEAGLKANAWAASLGDLELGLTGAGAETLRPTATAGRKWIGAKGTGRLRMHIEPPTRCATSPAGATARGHFHASILSELEVVSRWT